MARPQSNNADYFFHFQSMRNHRKVKLLRNKFGSVLGYAFWSMMLEYLIEHDGLEIEYSEFEFEMFAAELGVSAAEIIPIIDYCITIKLLFKTDSGFIYSESLNENLQPLFDKRQRERDRSKDRKRKEDGTFSAEKSSSGGVSAAEMPRSIVYSSIVENSNVVSKETIVGLPSATPTINGNGKKSISDRCVLFVEKFNDLKLEATGVRGKFKKTDKVLGKFKARMKDFKPDDILLAIKKAFKHEFHKEKNYQYVTPEYILRDDILQRYINANEGQLNTNTEFYKETQLRKQ